MIHEERFLRIIRVPHVSEKTSTLTEKMNTIVLKVSRNANKKEIKFAVQKLFKVKVKVVNILIVKGKSGQRGQRICRRKNWKKAYITLYKGQSLEFFNKTK